MQTDSELATLCAFYENRDVLITGATGFLGKVLIEKLLRSVPRIGTLYLLIRPSKKSPNVSARMHDEIVLSGVFDRLRARNPSFADKLKAVSGDVGNPDLGLSPSDRREICDKVSVVLHGAATVKFHEHFQVAFNINVEGVRRIVELCRDCKQLASVVHVSTAYVNATKLKKNSVINEVVEPLDFDHRAFQNQIMRMSVEEVDAATPILLKKHGDWPNTYTLTKRIGELVMKEEGLGLPFIIVRPTIVTCAEREPFSGWLDTLIGPGGLVLATALGLLHVMPGDPNNIVDLIPVDYVINCIIASSWYAATHRRDASDFPEVVHIGSSGKNATRWGLLLKVMRGYFDRHPSKHQIAPIHFRWVQSQFAFQFFHQLFHVAPAAAMDTVAFIKRTPTKKSYLSQISRLSGVMDTLVFFTSNEWTFAGANSDLIKSRMHAADSQDFSFDASEIIWDAYFDIFSHGLKMYILKEGVKYSQARL